MAPEPRPDGKIVELASFEGFIEADAALRQLEDAGIKAMRGADDGSGSLPNLAAVGGYAVLVFEDDLPAARAVLASEPAEASEDSESAD
jgi:hypothetical protein